MKIVFMGTPQFALPSLGALIKSEEVVGVVTQPDRPRGRGKKVEPSPVRKVAEKYQLPVYCPSSLHHLQFRNWLKDRNPEIIIVVAYGQILPPDILRFPSRGCLNAHASLLPRYRGAAPIERAIIKGEKKTGVTIIQMNEGLDAGDIILQEAVDIGPDDTAGVLGEKLSSLSAELLLKGLKKIKEGKVKVIPQNNKEATYVLPLKKSDGLIDWNTSAGNIHNLVRGLNPRLGAYTCIRRDKGPEKILKIWKTEPATGNQKGGTTTSRPGEVMGIIKDEGLVVSTGAGFLLIKEVQEEGSRKMPVREYLQGRPLKVGSILSK
ncbi:MAG: methionyl-tRNA formyltransferase [Nitrospirae bacterium]|nr:methionyl-tRNA formyltransferase [Nitrospirota bacterium]